LVTVASGDRPLSKIVLQNVEVLAIAQDIEQVNDKPQVVHVVTMLVTPDQAERLTLAGGQGGLRLALRNYDDRNVIATNGITVAQLLGAQPVAAPMPAEQHMVYAPRPRARPKPVNVEVLRDGKSSESVSFVRSGAGSGGESMQPATPESAAPAGNDAAAPAGDSGSSDNFVPTGSSMPSGVPAVANRPESGNATTGLTTGGIAAAAAPEPVLLNSAAAAGSSAPAGAVAASAYSGPRSKTIDVP
jgi:hypothetical protein